MTARLKLKATEGKDGVQRPSWVRVVAADDPPGGGGSLPLTPECQTPEALERALARLKDQLDALVLEARALFAKRVETAEDEAPQTAEGIWAAMERADGLEGMQRLFNGLDEERRREVANFVFTHANVFKGAASAFAQSYNEASGLLE